MSHQITKVDLIPNDELSVCNVSQFDNGRVLPFEILENKEAYTFPENIRVELHCRKADGNIVTLPSENITDNIVTFLSTTQLTACYGKNVCEIALYGPDDYLIGSGNFILDVEKSPTLGGINSTSEIHNLEEQIEEITTEIIGENYYNKTETDTKLALKANAADVYTKSQVDSALALKANAADVYTKSQVDSALALKANVADVYTKEQTYTQAEVDALIDNIFPTFTASGTIASFTTALTKPLVSVTAAADATTITRCGVNLWDEEWEVGGINGTTGNNNNESGCIRSKNYIRVYPGQTLYFKAPTTWTSHSIRGRCYKADGTYLQTLSFYDNTVFTIPTDCYLFRFVTPSGANVTTYGNDISINYPSTDTTYHPYTGNTVPVSDATTLITESGVNNVFANVGDVTVGYKYMPMPETQTNSNRLLLSSVNSDIIKEKSEIKEQSDIIEDIERGNKDE